MGSPRFSDILARGLLDCCFGWKISEPSSSWEKEEGADRDSMAVLVDDKDGSDNSDVEAIAAVAAAGPDPPGISPTPPENIDIPLSLLGGPTLLAREA